MYLLSTTNVKLKKSWGGEVREQRKGREIAFLRLQPSFAQIKSKILNKFAIFRRINADSCPSESRRRKCDCWLRPSTFPTRVWRLAGGSKQFFTLHLCYSSSSFILPAGKELDACLGH